MRVRQTHHYVIYYKFEKKGGSNFGVGMNQVRAKRLLNYKDLEDVIEAIKNAGGYEGVVITGFQEIRGN